MTHTPGPWTIENDHVVRGAPHKWPLGGATIPKADATQVATLHHGDEGSYVFYPRNTRDTNARLIAAAPDLLAALKDWEAYGRANGDEEAYSFLAKTRAAIAKAEGKDK